MSLHLANLSPRMRKDELERIFKSFGRCTVRLKDGYGFAVYDFRGDAEKALRTLKGRKICGESVYLSWSNKQPKPLQRFTGATRSQDMQYEKHSDWGDGFVGHRDYLTGDKKQPDKGRERHKSPKIHDDRHNFNLYDAGYDQREVILEEGGRVVVKPNQIDDGRWGEQVDNLRNVTDYEGTMGYDQYDPDRADERGEENEHRGLERIAGSHSVRTSPDKKNRRAHSDRKRGQQTCFKCGAIGHKMRDCSLKQALQEKSTYHPHHRHDSKAKNEAERAETRSGGRLVSCRRNSESARQPGIHGKISDSEKDGVKSKHSPVEDETKWDRRKDSNRSSQRESDDQIIESHDDKKKASALSHLHSDCASPELGTYSSPVKPLRGFSSQFKTGSPRPQPSHSLSVRYRSNSRSGRSRTNSRVHRSRSNSRFRRSRSNSRVRRSRSNSRVHRSRSRSIKINSRSRSPSSSLSISLDQSLPSSPNKAEVNWNAYSEGGASPLSREMQTEVRQHGEPEICEENLSITNDAEKSLTGCMDNLTSNPIMEDPIERMESKRDSDILTSTKHTEVSLNGFGGDDQIAHYQEAVLVESQWLEPQQNFEPPQTDAPLGNECVSSSGKVTDGMKLDEVLNDTDIDSSVPHVLCDLEAPSSSLLEEDDNEFAAVKMSAAELKENEEHGNVNVLKTTNSLEPANDNLDLEPPSNSYAGRHLSISAQELSRVLKHYGMKHPEEIEQHLDVGDYFGSSRLWPWEVIYYRRLKKGLISLENYARRVAQNQAFQITDKYIRSSSGWGESTEEHP